MSSVKPLLGRLYAAQTRLHLAAMMRYVEELEDKLNFDRNALRKKLTEEIAAAPEGLAHDVASAFDADSYLLDEAFVGLLRRSTVVGAYSFLEDRMNRVVDSLVSLDGPDIKPNNKRSAGIEQARNYLEKLCSIQFSAWGTEWRQLSALSRVRNCLVHCEGNIRRTRTPETLANIVRSTQGLSLRGDKYIDIHREYITSTLATIEKFLIRLYGAAFIHARYEDV